MVKHIYKKKKLRLKAKEKRKNEILKRCEMDLTDWNVIEKVFWNKIHCLITYQTEFHI